MNPKAVLIVCISFLFTWANAILPQVAIPLATTTAIAGTAGGGTATLLAAAGAAKLLGAGLLAATALSGSKRGRRSAEIDVEGTIKVIEELEPQQCMRKLICDLAATNQENNPIFIALGKSGRKLSFEEDALNAGFEFRAAARVGEYLKDVEKCGLRFTCSFDNQQLLQIASS